MAGSVLPAHTNCVNKQNWPVSVYRPVFKCIPLKSGRYCKTNGLFGVDSQASQSLWSQGGTARQKKVLLHGERGLNPFEVREVLQDEVVTYNKAQIVSIPLKSGRYCKNTRKRAICAGNVSIPLKSGRYCKAVKNQIAPTGLSQSLWSQGGTARAKYRSGKSNEVSQSLWSQGGTASVSELLAFALEASQSLWSQGGTVR